MDDLYILILEAWQVNDKTPKLAVFISDLDCGGAQRVVLTLAEGFVAQGCSVDMIIARGGGILENEVPEGVRLINLCDVKTGKLFFSFKVFVGLIRYLRNIQPEAILSSITGANLVAVLAKCLIRSKATLVLRHENTSLNLCSHLFGWLMGRLYPLADAVITVSSGAATDLKNGLGLPVENINIIENPVNLDRIRDLSLESPSCSWFDDLHVPVLLGVGRLYPQKDFETLIRAFSKLHTIKKAQLIILGEGPERARLEELIKQFRLEGSVFLPGIVQNPYPWMRMADLFVLSSRWEGLPVALIEAMALGCKVVATDCHSGPRELLEDGRLGWLVPVGDEEALKNAMLFALDTYRDSQLVISKANVYDPGSIVLKHLKLLNVYRF